MKVRLCRVFARLRGRYSPQDLCIVGIFISSYLVYYAFAFHAYYLGGNYTHSKSLFVFGDEVVYLVHAKAVVWNHDLFVENIYRNPSPEFLTPFPNDWFAREGLEGHWFPWPPRIGLPMLLAPFYLLSGAFGCLVFICLCGALVNTYVFKVSEKLTHNCKVSTATAVIFGFASVLLPYSNQLFPEVPMACITLFAVYQTLFKEHTWKNLLITASVLGFSLLLKPNYFAIIMVVSIFVLLRCVRQKRVKNFPFFVCPIIVWIAVYGYYFYHAYGDYFVLVDALFASLRSGAYGPLHGHFRFDPQHVLSGLLGIFLDRYHGLFVFSPVMLLGIFGVWGFLKADRTCFLYVLGVFLADYVPASFWFDWWGGMSYPGRMIMSVVPLLSVPFSFALTRYFKERWFKVLFVAVTAISFMINVITTAYRGLGLANGFGSHLYPFLKGFGLDIEALFPPFKGLSQGTPLNSNDWINVTLFIVISLYLLYKTRHNYK